MSVLIRGIQMPKNCNECPVALSGKYCRINKTYTTFVKLLVRPDHCPLVELPEKHGDLIDRDAIKQAVYHHLCIKGEENLLPAEKSIFGNLIKAQAIIEAEGAEE